MERLPGVQVMNNSQIKGSSRDEQRKNREVADKVTDGKNTNKKGKAAKSEGRSDPVMGEATDETRKEAK